jgi:hypothetical protein
MIRALWQRLLMLEKVPYMEALLKFDSSLTSVLKLPQDFVKSPILIMNLKHNSDDDEINDYD